jgi:hypothetical protein
LWGGLLQILGVEGGLNVSGETNPPCPKVDWGLPTAGLSKKIANIFENLRSCGRVERIVIIS